VFNLGIIHYLWDSAEWNIHNMQKESFTETLHLRVTVFQRRNVRFNFCYLQALNLKIKLTSFLSYLSITTLYSFLY
jgi:hypothetical protein